MWCIQIKTNQNTKLWSDDLAFFIDQRNRKENIYYYSQECEPPPIYHDGSSST